MYQLQIEQCEDMVSVFTTEDGNIAECIAEYDVSIKSFDIESELCIALGATKEEVKEYVDEITSLLDVIREENEDRFNEFPSWVAVVYEDLFHSDVTHTDNERYDIYRNIEENTVLYNYDELEETYLEMYSICLHTVEHFDIYLSDYVTDWASNNGYHGIPNSDLYYLYEGSF